MARHVYSELHGPIFSEPVFGEDKLIQDPDGFLTDHPSDSQIYKQIEGLLQKDTVGFPPSRIDDHAVYSLSEAYGPSGAAIVGAIQQAGRIVFHSVGDTGASKESDYARQVKAADQVSADCRTSEIADRASFLLHLGDVVYNFGESAYYYDQFYDPYRNYPAAIFAIPGNHDSFIVPGTDEADEPLKVFMRNFCAERPVVTAEAGSLHRTAMTQPGVYYTLDAPFVRIICLFSNALEDPGVISSENGRWPDVPDVQLAFLRSQLERIKDEAYQGAVLLATHHPAFSYYPDNGIAASHGGSPAMLAQIDEICRSVGVYPHAFLSGHAHLYQRYTRTVTFAGKEFDVPFMVAGSGGHHVNAIVRAQRGQPAIEPLNGSDVSYMDRNSVLGETALLLEKYEDRHFGYLRISVDAKSLRIGFHTVSGASLAQSRYDAVTIDLATHTMIAN